MLNVHLDNFDGPLDLLLFLIQREELNIYDIPIARVTEQYLEYIRALAQVDLVAASDFLVMAATLLGIKARMLLPAPPRAEEDPEWVEDPREELVRQLAAYAQMREVVDELRRLEGAALLAFPRGAAVPEPRRVLATGVSLADLAAALARVLADCDRWREVEPEEMPLKEKLAELSQVLAQHPQGLAFTGLFRRGWGRLTVVITFLALLEMIRQGQARIEQPAPFAPIFIVPTGRDPLPDAAALPPGALAGGVRASGG